MIALLSAVTKQRITYAAALSVVLCLQGRMMARAASPFYSGSAQAEKPSPSAHCPGPDENDTAIASASSYMQQGQYTDAIKTIEPLAAQYCDPRANLLLAAALETAGRRTDAEHTLEGAHAAWPADNRLAATLARQYLADRRPQSAAAALQNFQASASTQKQEIQVAVVAFIATHQLTKAEMAARVGYSNDPSVPSILLLANTLQLEGRYKDVIALLEVKREAYQSSAAFLVTLAQSEYDASMYGPCRTDVEHAIALDSTLYAAHYLRGNVLLKVGDAKEAEVAYRKAVDLSPAQPRTYYYLALALRAQHQEAEEVPLLLKAIALDDSYALAHCELGRILLNQNQTAEAASQLERAVSDNASSEQAYYLLSRAYSRLGEQEKADAMAKRLAEVRQANHHVATNLPGEASMAGQQQQP